MQLNLRVYGILLDDNRGLLVSDEWIRGGYYTKFPGGGLEVGEGTKDCLKREFVEEMNLKVGVGNHIYTTDYFQPSAFNSHHQIISIYYFVSPLEEISVPLRDKPFDFDETQRKLYEEKTEIETFRFIPFSKLSVESVTLPIDKLVVEMILHGLRP